MAIDAEKMQISCRKEKEQALKVVKLLSAVESWSLSHDKTPLPDYLQYDLEQIISHYSGIILVEHPEDITFREYEG